MVGESAGILSSVGMESSFRFGARRRGHKANAASGVKWQPGLTIGSLRFAALSSSVVSAMGADDQLRTYLVVIDDSDEARIALRFAARRAAKTGGAVEVLAIIEPQEFVQWGGVQAAIEEEQRLRIEGIVSAAVGEILDEAGVKASIIVRHGEPVKVVRDFVGEREEVAALVLGAAPSGSPGPLVANFTGNDAGKLPCPVMIIPGSLSEERLEQLS
jgi:nucleotide-binding universal stress UspA family protein